MFGSRLQGAHSIETVGAWIVQKSSFNLIDRGKQWPSLWQSLQILSIVDILLVNFFIKYSDVWIQISCCASKCTLFLFFISSLWESLFDRYWMFVRALHTAQCMFSHLVSTLKSVAVYHGFTILIIINGSYRLLKTTTTAASAACWCVHFTSAVTSYLYILYFSLCLKLTSFNCLLLQTTHCCCMKEGIHNRMRSKDERKGAKK